MLSIRDRERIGFLSAATSRSRFESAHADDRMRVQEIGDIGIEPTDGPPNAQLHGGLGAEH
jgi:hypothetical protein